MRPFTDLIVWQKSHELTLMTYQLTQAFPAEERFGLTSQMRRAASSIPANIAEGSARGLREFGQSLTVALGSAAEVDYFLILAADLGYITGAERDKCAGTVTEVKRLLVAFRKTVQRQASRETPRRATTKS